MLSPAELKEIEHELAHYEQPSAATIDRRVKYRNVPMIDIKST